MLLRLVVRKNKIGPLIYRRHVPPVLSEVFRMRVGRTNLSGVRKVPYGCNTHKYVRNTILTLAPAIVGARSWKNGYIIIVYRNPK